MKQKLGLAFTLSCLSLGLSAQQANPTDASREDNAAFVFTESQLNENDDMSQDANAFVFSNDDVYLSNVGYLFSPMRFRVRGYDSQYNDMYINGIRFNDAETGRFSYGLIGGLNDVTRNKEGVDGFSPNLFSYSPIGGATNINVRASQYAPGSKITLSGCNRNYVMRGIYTYSTGLMNNGWAFTGSLSYRWGKNGAIEGIYYNSLGYFLAAEKVFNDRHSLALSTWGSPTERSQQAASTEEAYYLANSHYYNPNWGYQDGKMRNARVVRAFEPSAVATWNFNINDKMRLVTSFAAKYTNDGRSALGWNGNASDPRPDYYKKLPSALFNVYDDSTPLAQEQIDLFNETTERWKSSKANRQIDWDQMYFANAQANALGKETLYYVEERHNDQLAFNLSSTFNHNLENGDNYTVGILAGSSKGMHYKKMKDLMGGELYTDIDKFAARDYGYNSIVIQNDLTNPNHRISEGDKFGYNYNIIVNKQSAWAQYNGHSEYIDYYVSGQIGSTQFWRDGKMQNGRSPLHSLGKSGTARFLEGGGKFGIVYKINGKHQLILNGRYEDRAPLAYNSFIAPRIKDDYVDGLKTEKIAGGDFTYSFNTPVVIGRITGYYTRFFDQVEMDAFYNDNESRFTYLAMSGIEKEHWGVEAAATFRLTSELSLTAIGTWSDARYMNNPNAIKTYESEVEGERQQDRVYAEGLRANGTPLSAYSLALDYNVNGWFFNVTGNYYHRTYIDFSTYRRLESVLKRSAGAVDEKGNVVPAKVPGQEELDGGFMMDVSIGKYIRLKDGKSLSINLNINNLLNNTDMRTGGYEQNRDDSYDDGSARAYVFSRNSKYYYASRCNAFLNLGFRF